MRLKVPARRESEGVLSHQGGRFRLILILLPREKDFDDPNSDAYVKCQRNPLLGGSPFQGEPSCLTNPPFPDGATARSRPG